MFGAKCCQVEFYVASQLCGGVECIVPYVEIWYKNLTYKNACKQNVQKVDPKKKFFFLLKILNNALVGEQIGGWYSVLKARC